MILQSLCEYYSEQVQLGNPDYAPAGMELKRIHFVLVLDRTGTLREIEQLAKKVHVVRSRSRSGKDACRTPNRLWDSLGFVTGYGDNEKRRETIAVQHASFKEEVKRLSGEFPNNVAFAAVAAFYANRDYFKWLSEHPLWDEVCRKQGHNLSFRLCDEQRLAAQQDELLAIQQPDGKPGGCLVSGNKAMIARLHPKLHIAGGSSTGTKLVSFMTGCGYDSYYKQGGENAPVSIELTEAYGAALTGLLQEGSSNKVVIGGVSFLFFTLPHTNFDEVFRMLMDPSIKTDREELLVQVCDILYSAESEIEFILIAIVPNAARLSIRLYLRTTIGELSGNILSFYNDIALEHRSELKEPIPLLSPLLFAAPQGNIEKLPPQLIIDYLYAVATYGAFPVQLQMEFLARQRQSREINLGALMMLRCYLNRTITSSKYSISMALDKENRDIGYLLGRIFAILERTQEMSNPGIGFTIRDSYYNIASITPAAVFNRLIGLSNTYFRKVPALGMAIYLKKQLSEVTGMFDGANVPARLSLDEQSRFALGYFHQRQTYFTKKEQTYEQSH